MPTHRTRRVPVRRNRLAADLSEALDAALSYAEDASRYAREEGAVGIEGHIENAIYALNNALSEVEYDDKDDDDDY